MLGRSLTCVVHVDLKTTTRTLKRLLAMVYQLTTHMGTVSRISNILMNHKSWIVDVLCISYCMYRNAKSLWMDGYPFLFFFLLYAHQPNHSYLFVMLCCVYCFVCGCNFTFVIFSTSLAYFAWIIGYIRSSIAVCLFSNRNRNRRCG